MSFRIRVLAGGALAASLAMVSLAQAQAQTQPQPQGQAQPYAGYGCPGMAMMGPGMMGPGMMGPGMMGYGMMGGMMGPGMMGGMMGPGMMGRGMMGPGMMGPGMMGQGYAAPPALNLSVSDVRTYLERWVAMNGNPRVKVGAVTQRDANTIVGDIVTTDKDALVQRFAFDRNSGVMQNVQ